MPPAPTEPEAYMDAFMNGFEFVLLAMRGRLAEGALPASEKARIETFLEDYAKIARSYRERKDAVVPGGLAFHGRVQVDLEAATTN